MNIEKIWNRIKQNEGNLFYTITGKEYRYVVYNDFLLVNDRKERRVTKEAIAKAMTIVNPTPKKIGAAGCWAPSYIYGIITDKRIQ